MKAKKKKDKNDFPDPQILSETSYTGSYSSNSSVTQTLFYKDLNVVLRVETYENDPKNPIIDATGGTAKKRAEAERRYKVRKPTGLVG